MLEDLAKFNGLRVFSLVLLVIATPQGRQIYDTANSVEAERGIKTFTWDVVEDNDHEIDREHEDEEHDEDSLDLAIEKRSCSYSKICSDLNDKISKYDPATKEKMCSAVGGCACSKDHYGKCDRCTKNDAMQNQGTKKKL